MMREAMESGVGGKTIGACCHHEHVSVAKVAPNDKYSTTGTATNLARLASTFDS